jgi:hypothetical protein
MGVRNVKATLEIPDPVFRKAKAKAAQRGIPLRRFVTEAVENKLAATGKAGEKPWMKGLGALRHLGSKEHERIRRIIEEEFEQIEPEDRLRFWTQTPCRRWPRDRVRWAGR